MTHRLVSRCWNMISWQQSCWHVGQTLGAKLNQPDFQRLLMLIQRSARKREIGWESTTVVLWETGFSSIFLFSCKWKTCPTLHDYAWLHPGPSLIRMSTVTLNFLQLCCCYWFLSQPRHLRPDSAAIRGNFPISNCYSVEFNLSNAYRCIPSR